MSTFWWFFTVFLDSDDVCTSNCQEVWDIGFLIQPSRLLNTTSSEEIYANWNKLCHSLKLNELIFVRFPVCIKPSSTNLTQIVFEPTALNIFIFVKNELLVGFRWIVWTWNNILKLNRIQVWDQNIAMFPKEAWPKLGSSFSSILQDTIFCMGQKGLKDVYYCITGDMPASLEYRN